MFRVAPINAWLAPHVWRDEKDFLYERAMKSSMRAQSITFSSAGDVRKASASLASSYGNRENREGTSRRNLSRSKLAGNDIDWGSGE